MPTLDKTLCGTVWPIAAVELGLIYRTCKWLFLLASQTV